MLFYDRIHLFLSTQLFRNLPSSIQAPHWQNLTNALFIKNKTTAAVALSLVRDLSHPSFCANCRQVDTQSRLVIDSDSVHRFGRSCLQLLVALAINLRLVSWTFGLLCLQESKCWVSALRRIEYGNTACGQFVLRSSCMRGGAKPQRDIKKNDSEVLCIRQPFSGATLMLYVLPQCLKFMSRFVINERLGWL